MPKKFKSETIVPGFRVDVNVRTGNRDNTVLIELRLEDNVLCAQLDWNQRMKLVDLLLYDTEQVRYTP